MWNEVDNGLKNKVALIGVGNPLRGDDGAGIEVAHQLRQLIDDDTVEFTDVYGDGTELMSAWEGTGVVYIFDAVMNQGAPGRIHRLDANRQTIPSDYFKYSSHAFGVAEAIELGKTLGTLPEKAIIYGMEGSSFRHGQPITDEVQDAIATVISRFQLEFLQGDTITERGFAAG